MWSMQLEVERMPVKFPLSGTYNMVVIIYLILNLSISLCFHRHGWLHSIVDDPPTVSNYVKSAGDCGHIDNVTGTADRYAPYNTTKPKLTHFQVEGSSSGFQSIGDKIKIKSANAYSLLKK